MNTQPPMTPTQQKTLAAIISTILILSFYAAGVVYHSITPVPLPHSTPTAPVPSPVPQSVCGVHHVGTSYTFDWLHVSATGDIVNANNCRVLLYGWNSVGAMLGTGGSTGDGTGNGPVLHGDIVRVAFNERWYTDNVYVPKQGIHYQQWLQTVVKTEESRGNYVILDADTAFFDPPCGSDGKGTNVTFCPSEDQGRKDYANPKSPYYHNPRSLEEYQPVALNALRELAQVYAHDSAVLFDVWNEPASYIFVVPTTESQRVAEMNTRINMVRQFAPQAPVIVFTAGDSENLSYSQTNLIFDFHIYPTFHGISPETHQPCSTSSPDPLSIAPRMDMLRQHGRAILIGEWGGCNDLASYNSEMVSLAEREHAAMTYFTYDDLVIKSVVTANGELVKQDYTTLFAQGG